MVEKNNSIMPDDFFTAAEVRAFMMKNADAQEAAHSQRFFKTGPGEYGEGDLFLGIRVPYMRALVPRALRLTLPELHSLLCDPYHELRMAALLIMNRQFELLARFRLPDTMRDLLEASGGSFPVTPDAYRCQLIDFYFSHTKYINNWDLVDLSVNMVGEWYLKRDRAFLHGLAYSGSLWERRIAIVSTVVFIRAGQLEDTFAMSTVLLNDNHDLIHKAVGWMLREAGKRDMEALEDFLERSWAHMPRTTLRYAIERFSPERRNFWLTRRY